MSESDQTVPEILQTAVRGDAEELHETLRSKALGSFFFFTKVVLGYDKLAAHLHLPFCQHVQNSEAKRKRGYLLPRGHFKSTIVAKSYPLWRTAKAGGDFRTLILGESDTVAKKNLKDPKWHLENNQLLRWLFPEIIPPDINKTKWTDTEILLPRPKSYDESTITTAGVGARFTGHHFNLIIYDDMIGEASASSEAIMQDAIEYFEYAPGLLDDPANGEEILIGTRWKHGKADLYGYIMDQMPEERLASGRLIGFEWLVRAAVEDDEPIFPERFSLEVLEEIRKRLGDYKFYCQYMNNPIAPGVTDFNEADLQEYTVGEDKKTIQPSDGSPLTRLSQLHRIQVFDPATKSKTSKARPAVVALGMDSQRRVFVLDTWSEHATMGDGVEKMALFNDKYIFWRSYYELAGQQQAVEDILAERRGQTECRRCKQKHRGMTVLPETARSSDLSKEDRIRHYLQTLIQEHRLYLRRGQTALRKQIIEFPNGDVVDLLDALAYGAHLVRPPLSDEAIQDEYDQEVQRKQAIRTQRINTEHSYGGYV